MPGQYGPQTGGEGGHGHVPRHGGQPGKVTLKSYSLTPKVNPVFKVKLIYI